MKKISITTFLFVFSLGILQAQSINEKSSRKYFNNQKILTLNSQPISFYLNHPNIDVNSKSFYKGELAASSSIITQGMLDSVLTRNNETRPFYFFVLNKIVDLSENDIAGMVSERCKNYIKSFPCEFFNELNQHEFEINVVKWTTYVGQSCSGGSKYVIFRNEVDLKIKTNCNEIYDLWRSFNNEVRMSIVR
ncbi:MAG: hypothetical protein AB9846_04500 [Tenuifilaceae bacterium]